VLKLLSSPVPEARWAVTRRAIRIPFCAGLVAAALFASVAPADPPKEPAEPKKQP
jgi:hypothetical protein